MNETMGLILAALLAGSATAIGLGFGAVAGQTSDETDSPVEIWLVVDGVAIGTVEPGTLEYDLEESVIRVSSNELIYGCQQARIFRDRFQVSP